MQANICFADYKTLYDIPSLSVPDGVISKEEVKFGTEITKPKVTLGDAADRKEMESGAWNRENYFDHKRDKKTEQTVVKVENEKNRFLL